MKKIFTLFMMLALSISLGWAADETFTFYASNYAGSPNGSQIGSLTSDNGEVVLTFYLGGNTTTTNVPKFYETYSNKVFRIYGKNLFTVDVPNGQYIKSLEFTFLTAREFSFTNGTTNLGSYSNNVWTAGNDLVSSLVVQNTETGQANITQIKITYGPASTTPVESVAAPTFSPDPGEVEAGTEVTISTATTGASIYYTTNGTIPTAESTLYTAPIVINEDMTITAIAIKGEESSDPAIASYTVSSTGGGSTGTTYQRITSTTDLEVGAKYIIVNENNGKALWFDGSAAKSKDVTINSDNTIRLAEDGASVLTLGSSTYGYNFETGGQYINHSSSTTIDLVSAIGGKCSWAVTFVTAGNVTIKNYNSDRLLRYYTNGTFRAYQSTSYGENIHLYKEVPNLDKADDPTITSPTAGDVIGQQTVTITQPNGGTIFYQTVTGTGDPDAEAWLTYDASNQPTINGEPGTSVTVYAYANEDGKTDPSNQVGVTYNFVRPAAPTIAPATQETQDAAVSVTITGVEGATLYYTVDDTAPTAESTTYSAPFDVALDAIGATATVRAIAVVNGVESLEATSAVYTRVGVNPGTVTIAPGSRYFSADFDATITAGENAAKIVYKLNDGAETEVVGNTATVNISGTETVTLTAWAVSADGTAGEVATATYTHAETTKYQRINSTDDLEVGAKYIIVNEQYGKAMWFDGSTSSSGDVSINDGVASVAEGTVTEFTLDGTTGSYKFTVGSNALANTGKQTGLSLGTTANTWQVTFSENSNDAEIRHKDTADKWRYVRYLSSSTKFMAYLSTNDYNNSLTIQLYKEVNENQADAPVITSPTAGDVIGSQTVTITQPNGGTIYYQTVTGTGDPDAEGWLPYDDSNKLTINGNVGETVTVYAYATEAGKTDPSKQVSAAYTFVRPAAPTISPASMETQAATVSVTITGVEGATLHYTTDNTEPTTESPTYAAAFDVEIPNVGDVVTVRAIAVVNGVASEEATAATYTHVGVNPGTVTISPNSKSFSAAFDATITADDTEKAVKIVYTLNDGDEIEVIGTTATVNISGRADVVLKAWAVSADGTKGTAATATYTFTKMRRFEKITSADQLKAGKDYIISRMDDIRLMGSQYQSYYRQSSSNFTRESASVVLVPENSDVAIITLGGDVENGWTLFTNDNGKYIRLTSDGTSYMSPGNADEKAMMNITINEETAQATIASIAFPARYIRANNQSGYRFDFYKSNTNNVNDIALYIEADWTLAQMAEKGVENTDYTVADDLQVVYVKDNNVWVRDLNAEDCVNQTEMPTDGQIDFMRDIVYQMPTEWQQNNWARIDFSNATAQKPSEGDIIAGGTLDAKLVNTDNLTLEVKATADLEVSGNESYAHNVYCAANFYSSTTQVGTNGKTYWFMRPRTNEVALITASVWNGDGFYMPQKGVVDGHIFNSAGMKGAFGIDNTYDPTADPQVGEAYEFLAVIAKKEAGGSTPAPRRLGVQDGATPANSEFIVYPLTLSTPQIVTGVNELPLGSEVVGVTYTDITGRTSDKPFEGLNIVVTRYSDGSSSTVKVVR